LSHMRVNPVEREMYRPLICAKRIPTCINNVSIMNIIQIRAEYVLAVWVQVFLDGAIIPGWEGKIVAWVEEDRGEER